MDQKKRRHDIPESRENGAIARQLIDPEAARRAPFSAHATAETIWYQRQKKDGKLGNEVSTAKYTSNEDGSSMRQIAHTGFVVLPLLRLFSDRLRLWKQASIHERDNYTNISHTGYNYDYIQVHYILLQH